mmetsp:Transcript_5023/g.18749  ORF Transcript_5023/g.18749 Transcript_5023/m.18749 type:complete len:230 (+) Transcript_5023:3463-4152(+)
MSFLVSYQFRYSFKSSYIAGAVGCQMPVSGNSSGSAMTMSMSFSAGTYALEIIRRKFSRLSVLPPSQYCREFMKFRASAALSEGRYFSTLGSVLTSLSMPSSNPPDSFFFFMKDAMADLLCPSCAMENVPSLFRRITAGMEGKMRHASRLSRSGVTISTTFSASSSMKISDPMKMLDSSTSFFNIARFFTSRSSSRRYPETSKQTLSLFVLSWFTAADSADWYCGSKTT